MGFWKPTRKRQTAIPHHQHQHKPKPDDSHECNCMRLSANQDIALSTFGLIAPTILLTAALWTFVLLYKVDKASILPVDSSKNEDGVIYVDASSTLLIFVSSWMSSLVPLLTVCAITLATYPIAQRLLEDSTLNTQKSLMTSLQLGIAIKFVNGSTWSSLWNLFRYSMCRNRPVTSCSTVLISITAVTIVAVVLGVAVMVADTWLHVATESVNVIQLSSLQPESALYSLGIQPQCMGTDNSFSALEASNSSCTVSTTFTFPDIADKTMALQILNGQSDLYSVLAHPQERSMHYLSVAATNTSHDYNATTFAASTTCIPITTQCNLSINTISDTNATWSCNGGAFAGSGDALVNNGVLRQSYRYFDMTGTEGQWPLDGVNNPFFTAGAVTNQLSVAASQSQADDPDILVTKKSAISAIFLCNTTIFDVSYEVLHGELFSFSTKNSNISTTNLFASGITDTQFGSSNICIDLDIAAPYIPSAQAYADAFANVLNQAALASGATSVHRIPIVTGQIRNVLIVSRIPTAPLFLLTALNLGFVILGLVLTTLASLTTHEARSVQIRLSIAGVVANIFQKHKSSTQATVADGFLANYDSSTEDVRVNIHRTSTGIFLFRGV